jgi:peptidyl-prolyl cis-trans isomerase C
MRTTVRVITIPIALAAALIISSCGKRPPTAEPSSAAALFEVTVKDKTIIVAKVNGTELTNYALINMMNRIRLMNERASLAEPEAILRKKALDQLVLQELALQTAARKGMSVEDAFIDRTMAQFISKLGHEEGYKEYLAKNFMTTVEFRAQVEQSLTIQRILMEEVIKKSSVTEEDIKNEYEATKAEYVEQEEFSVVDIAVSRKQGDQAAMKKAQELLAAITAGKDKDPSHLVSDATFSVSNVSLDRDKEPTLYEAARKLPAAGLSGVIAGNDAMHILKLTGSSPARQKSYEEVKNIVEGKLKNDAYLKRRQDWERELKKDAKIEILDPGKP